MKQYIIFAGVNGAGKSTLYQTFPKYGQIPRINTDEILRTFGDWKRTEVRRIAIYKNGIPVRISHNLPDWFKRI